MRFLLILLSTTLLLAGCGKKLVFDPPQALEEKQADQVDLGGRTAQPDPCTEKDPVTKLCK